MKIYTSYFAKLKILKKNRIVPIGVAIRPPKWFTDVSLFELAPTHAMLIGTMNKTMTLAEYDKKYSALLEKVNSQVIKRKIEEISQGKDVALLCFEKDRKDCHRDSLAKWLEEKLNIKVNEFIDESDIKKEAGEKRKEADKLQSSLF